MCHYGNPNCRDTSDDTHECRVAAVELERTIPELRHWGRLMRHEPVGASLDEVVRALRDGTTTEVRLEPGDGTRYDLVLVPDIAIPRAMQLTGEDQLVGVLAIRMMCGVPAKAVMLLPWERGAFGSLSTGNEWTTTVLAWWFGILFDALGDAAEAAADA